MPNYSLSTWVDAQLKVNEAFQAPEMRYIDPAVHKMFLRNSSFTLENWEAAKTDVNRALQINYKVRTKRTLGGAPSHNHTGTQGDSGVFVPNWEYVSDVFAGTMKEANDKIYTFDDIEMDKLSNTFINFVDGMEERASDYLFANTSAINLANADGTFNAANKTYEFTEADVEDRIIVATTTAMKINGYGGFSYDIVCDSVAFNKFSTAAQQGPSNSINKSFQYAGITFIHDVRLDAAAAGLPASYTAGYWIVVPTGTISLLPWMPIQYRQGRDEKEAIFTQITNPIDGMPLAVHMYQERADGTSLGGQLQDIKYETQLWSQVSYNHAPLSNDPTESPLFGFAFV